MRSGPSWRKTRRNDGKLNSSVDGLEGAIDPVHDLAPVRSLVALASIAADYCAATKRLASAIKNYTSTQSGLQAIVGEIEVPMLRNSTNCWILRPKTPWPV